MKLKYLFSVAVAGFLFGACSSDDVVVGGDNQNGAAAVQPGEEGFLSMSISLPTTVTGVRAAGYDDGTPDEYQVNNAKLLLFYGMDEAAAKLHRVYDLEVSAFTKNDETQITSSANIVQEIQVPPTEEGQQKPNYYAMVVLNDNGLLPSEGDASSTDFYQKTFKDVSELAKELDEDKLRTQGGTPSFFMSNAPMYSVAGGTVRPDDDGEVTTLAEIDPDMIFQTELEARQNPAVTVYVERALAKVTVTATDGNVAEEANDNLASYKVEGWTLDNTNKFTYLVRNVAPANLTTAQPAWWQYNNITANYYRFVDVAAVETNVSLYRTHFGIDPNYDVTNNYGKDDAVLNSVGKIPASLTSVGDNLYCLENTFDVERMREQNTTRVIVAAKLTMKNGAEPSGDFYLLNKNTATIYQKAGVENEVKRLWMNYFQTIISDYVKEGTFTEDNVTVTLSNATGAAQANGGYTTVTGIVMNDDGVEKLEYKNGKTLDDINAAAAAYLPTLNKMLTISYYKGGVAYYPVLIQHFGDTETPWTMPGNGVFESYPGMDAASKWLGRYGVLRNTWYTVNVTGLKNIGFCEVPDASTRYDDPLNQYIAVEIHILPWATRSQNVEL